MAIDWRLANTPDFLATFVNAYGAGKAVARENALGAAYKTYASDPEAGAHQATAIDPREGAALTRDYQAQQDRHQEQTDAAIQRAKALTAEQRAMAREHAEAGGAILIGLQHHYPEGPERDAAWAHLKEGLAQHGYSPEELAAIDTSDKGIGATVESLRDFHSALEQMDERSKPYTLGPGQRRMEGSEEIAAVPDRIPFGWEDDGQGGIRPKPNGPADPTYLGRRAAATRKPAGGGRGGGSAATGGISSYSNPGVR